MYNSIYDKNAKKRLGNVLKHEGCSMEKLQQELGMSERQIFIGVRFGCHDITGSISKVFGKSMIQRYLLEPGRYYYDKNGELRPINLK